MQDKMKTQRKLQQAAIAIELCSYHGHRKQIGQWAQSTKQQYN